MKKISPYLRLLVQQDGYINKGDYIYKEQDGYLITILESVNSQARQAIVSFYNAVESEAASHSLVDFVQQYKKQYKLTAVSLTPNGICLAFYDPKKITAFLPVLLPEMKALGLKGTGTCCRCGKPLDAVGQVALLGNCVAHVHTDCFQEAVSAFTSELQIQQYEPKHYMLGTMGAFLGGLVGAIPWLIVFLLGYVSGWLGIAIAWGANKGYQIAGGKNGKGKAPILILMVVLSVFVSQFMGYWIGIAISGWEGSILDIPYAIFATLFIDPEFASQYLRDLLMSLLFSGLGIWWIFRTVKLENPAKNLHYEILNDQKTF